MEIEKTLPRVIERDSRLVVDKPRKYGMRSFVVYITSVSYGSTQQTFLEREEHIHSAKVIGPGYRETQSQEVLLDSLGVDVGPVPHRLTRRLRGRAELRRAKEALVVKKAWANG